MPGSCISTNRGRCHLCVVACAHESACHSWSGQLDGVLEVEGVQHECVEVSGMSQSALITLLWYKAQDFACEKRECFHLLLGCYASCDLRRRRVSSLLGHWPCTTPVRIVKSF